MADSSEKEKILQQLKAYQSLNDGHGPVVPKWMVDHLRKLGIKDGYVEAKMIK